MSPVRTRTPVTYALIAACIAVWIAEVARRGLVDELAFVPALGMSEPWRWITSAFTHDDALPVHIASNMLALFMLGRGMETFLGRARFLGIYALSALGGTLTYVLTATPPTAAAPLGHNWQVGLVGASGAVFGLFGALLVIQRQLGQSTTQLWVVLALNAALTFTIPGIAWQAHVGGFLTGLVTMALLMWLIRKPRVVTSVRPDGTPVIPPPPRTWPVMVGVLAVLVALAVVKYTVLV